MFRRTKDKAAAAAAAPTRPQEEAASHPQPAPLEVLVVDYERHRWADAFAARDKSVRVHQATWSQLSVVAEPATPKPIVHIKPRPGTDEGAPHHPLLC